MTLWTQLVTAVWLLWGATWLAAWLWADRTIARATRRVQAGYRLFTLAGFAGLFVDPLLVPVHGRIVPHPLLGQAWSAPPALGAACLLLAMISFAFALWARVTLGRLWSAAVTRKQGHRIVETGPYALVRHPIYTALIGGALALAVAKGSNLALLGLGSILLGYYRKARVEERFLAAELGPQAYAAYRRRVPMLVPFARR